MTEARSSTAVQPGRNRRQSFDSQQQQRIDVDLPVSQSYPTYHHSLLLTYPFIMSMLPRAARPALQGLAAARSTVATAGGFHSSATQMATLRELEQRVRSVRNIEKITKSMKMIASTKLTKAQKAMQAARAYGKANEGEQSGRVGVTGSSWRRDHTW